MDTAFCTEDGITYEAVQFSRLPPIELARKRRLLQCSECHATAFFRKASRSGRAACFGARPHVEDCDLAALDHEAIDGQGDDDDVLNNPGERIAVDLNYGAHQQQPRPVIPGEGRAGNRGRRFVGDGARPDARVHRRLSTLLRTLLDVPAFSRSTQILEIEGINDIAVRDFFVPIEHVSIDNEGQFRGFWGMLSDARFSPDGTLWLNSGGRDDVSFCIDSNHVDDIYTRYHLEDEEDLAGANVLVLGTLRVSQNGKMYCVVPDSGYLAVRLG